MWNGLIKETGGTLWSHREIPNDKVIILAANTELRTLPKNSLQPRIYGDDAVPSDTRPSSTTKRARNKKIASVLLVVERRTSLANIFKQQL